MLHAEIHGKIVPEALNSEDYLTSCVFGHLRYISPGPFWASLFTRAKGVGQEPPNLSQRLVQQGLDLQVYEFIEVNFWVNHPLLGEPDLILQFSGKDRPSIWVIIEVKLWSLKGGSGEDDQLGRYLRLMARLHEIGLPVCSGDSTFLVYLTPRDSLAEIEETLATDTELEPHRQSIFRLQWQDILDVARQCQTIVTGWERSILTDVVDFLQRRNLEYFRGFRPVSDLPVFREEDGRFYVSRHIQARRFQGWTIVHELGLVEVQAGGWIR